MLQSQEYDLVRGRHGASPLPQVSGQFAIAATLGRNQGMVNSVSVANAGVLLLIAINIPDQVVITNLSFLAGSSGQGSGNHAWMVLYRGDLTLLGQTPDNTSATAIVANTVFTQALNTPIKTPYSGMYYIGIMTTAVSQAFACGIIQVTNAALQAQSPILSGTTGASLTGTAPATAAALTVNSNIPYMWVS